MSVMVETKFFDNSLKVTMEAALGLVGGTMGLLTGFSILSGVEILYYLLQFIMSLDISKVQKFVNKYLH